jgi:hypothetical protein
VNRPILGLLSAVALYLGLRAGVLYTDFDSVGMTMYELYPMGTLPRILLEGGIDVPLRHFYDNAAGQLLTGLLALPFYAALGPTYLSLKLVPLLLGLAALFVTWAFLRRNVGERAAVIGALLFALPPATLVKYSLKASGNHYENVFFTMLAMWALWRVHAGGNRSLRLWIAGYCMGLALFVFLGAIIPVGLLALTHLGLVGWRQALRDGLQMLCGLVLGALPLILLNLSTSGRGAGFLAAKFGGSGRDFDLGRVASRWLDFFVVHMPDALTYPAFLGLSGRLAGALFLALFAVAYAVALPDALRACADLARGAVGRGVPQLGRLRDYALVPLVAYMPLTALAYGLSDLRMGGYAPPLEDGGYRYYIPTLLFACLLIAIVAARWLGSARLRPAGAGLCALALVTGAFDLGLIDTSGTRTGRGTHYEGYYMKQFARTLINPEEGFEVAEMIELAESFPPVFRARVYEGLGFYRALQAQTRMPLEQIELHSLSVEWPPEHHADVWRGVGSSLRVPLNGARREAALALLERWHATAPAATEEVLAGLAFEWDVVLASRTRAALALSLQLARSVPSDWTPAVVRGMGIHAGRSLRREIDSDAQAVAELWPLLPPGSEHAFLRGLGLGIADWGEGTGWPAGFVLPPDRDPEPLLEAMRARLVELHGERAAPELARLAAVLSADMQRAWEALPPLPGE